MAIAGTPISAESKGSQSPNGAELKGERGSQSANDVELDGSRVADCPAASRREPRQLLKPDPDPFPRYMFASLLLQGTALVLSFFSLLLVFFVLFRPPPSLVQVADGTPISVKPFSNRYRSPENLKRFSTAVARGLFTWSPRISQVDEFGQSKLVGDAGKAISLDGKSMRLPTSVWKAGFWLSPDFRQPFLQRLAELIPSDIWQGRQTSLQIRQVTEPIELAPGKWKVGVIADLAWDNPNTPPLEVNKVYYIALAAPSTPEGELAEFPQLIGELSRWGLTVTDIRNFKEEGRDFVN